MTGQTMRPYSLSRLDDADAVAVARGIAHRHDLPPRLSDDAAVRQVLACLFVAATDKMRAMNSQVSTIRAMGNTQKQEDGSVEQRPDFECRIVIGRPRRARIATLLRLTRPVARQATDDLDGDRAELFSSIAKMGEIADEIGKNGRSGINLMMRFVCARMDDVGVRRLSLCVPDLLLADGRRIDATLTLKIVPPIVNRLRGGLEDALDRLENAFGRRKHVSAEEMFAPGVKLTSLTIVHRDDEDKPAVEGR